MNNAASARKRPAPTAGPARVVSKKQKTNTQPIAVAMDAMANPSCVASLPLPDSIASELALDDTQQSTSSPSQQQPFLPSLITKLLHPKITAPAQAYNSKIRDRYLQLDNPPRDPLQRKKARDRSRKKRNAAVSAGGRKQKMRKRDGPLTATEKRKLGVYDVPKDQCKFELFEPLHQLWKEYMKDLIFGDSAPSSASPAQKLQPTYVLPKILKADFHGGILTVVRSKCPSYIGTSGIMFKETEHLFHLVTRQDQVKLIPKMNSVFTFVVGDSSCIFTLFGNHLASRASERVAKKFKDKFTIDL
ncbi:hypothetical protein SeMB42_g01539 [Synchytrium endobioticum]|uniref:Uncharacterized protein n=1 Tax=Synchytrium endobioticum TaxID=286115 RepID=A0A507DKZ2_9FUNG|nr:hypothetical protein SeLEV6574_g04404 [Synchytrium endobioticum]TPX52293.1 hypothetical protein SeMB42_g01539 [Synchytrium endobioticum]